MAAALAAAESTFLLVSLVAFYRVSEWVIRACEYVFNMYLHI